METNSTVVIRYFKRKHVSFADNTTEPVMLGDKILFCFFHSRIHSEGFWPFNTFIDAKHINKINGEINVRNWINSVYRWLSYFSLRPCVTPRVHSAIIYLLAVSHCDRLHFTYNFLRCHVCCRFFALARQGQGPNNASLLNFNSIEKQQLK